MKISYDPKSDAMIISFFEGKTSTRTEELSGDFLADYAEDKLISMEILDVSKKLPKNKFESITLNLPGITGKTAFN